MNRIEHLPRLDPRRDDSHKGLFGHALIVGGFHGMLGAAVIAGTACLRCGAGLVTLALPQRVQAAVALGNPCYMTLGLDEDAPLDHMEKSLKVPRFQQAVLAIGPGLGRSIRTDALVSRLYLDWPNPLIADADALNVLSESSTWHTRQAGEPTRILTPHPGEWERLSGVSSKNREDQIERAVELANQWNVIVVLKGAKTIVTNGRDFYQNQTGNPSLAVGGSGDCLTGMIASFLCQGMGPFESSILAVHLHGLAADIAHAALGTPSTLATDLFHYLPAAFRQYSANET